jgi:hypothetical protein
MNRAWIWGGFLSLPVFSLRVIRKLTNLAKDGSDIVAYHHLDIFDSSEFLIDHTQRTG